MDRKIALKWARALESGKYDQVDGALRNNRNEFCCLGVLCNLHAEAHPEIAAAQDDPQVYMGEQAELPEEVMDWAGMITTTGSFEKKIPMQIYPKDEDDDGIEHVESLIDMNDTFEQDFNKIAKAIRKYSDKL